MEADSDPPLPRRHSQSRSPSVSKLAVSRHSPSPLLTLSTEQQLRIFFENYSSTRVDLTRLQQSPHLQLKQYKQVVYYGEFRLGKREGLGIMLHASGQLYEGEWREDRKEGQGYERLANGCEYQGTYQKGLFQGVGKYLWTNGQTYEGEWKRGLREGTGVWRSPRGQSYAGEWKDGQAEGVGVYCQSNGTRYQGQFHHFMKHGQGTEKFASGDLYKGSYLKGKFHGFGEYYWQDGSYYKGYFEAGVRTGHGLWRKDTPNSDKYEGEFKANQKEGYGIYNWSEGHVYKGEYRGNVRNGYGEMRWADGSSYCGCWSEDRQSGEGVMEDGKGVKITGIFKEGVMVEVIKEEKLPKINLSASRSKHDSRKLSIKDRYSDTPIAALDTEHSSESKGVQMLITRQINPVNPIIQARTLRQRKYKVGNSFLPNSKLKKALAVTANSKSSSAKFSIFRSLDLKKRAAAASPNATMRNKMPHSSFQIQKLHESRQAQLSLHDLRLPLSSAQPRATQRMTALSRPAASRLLYLP